MVIYQRVTWGFKTMGDSNGFLEMGSHRSACCFFTVRFEDAWVFWWFLSYCPMVIDIYWVYIYTHYTYQCMCILYKNTLFCHISIWSYILPGIVVIFGCCMLLPSDYHRPLGLLGLAVEVVVSLVAHVPLALPAYFRLPSRNQTWCAGKWTIFVGDFPS